ncbi:uncharacterized protein YALI1_A14131g [Yarrowia lipolytica]|uniref:Uncharacterized protein n=1 Tax=Yarrowia lipolytica TaxID=4952 RepID=A0A1D8N4S2_YARLL|nr:hypothetical protein YALI1_A14131g [Yarrowia lipolytica]
MSGIAPFILLAKHFCMNYRLINDINTHVVHCLQKHKRDQQWQMKQTLVDNFVKLLCALVTPQCRENVDTHWNRQKAPVLTITFVYLV